jgi:hypothetical protein
VYGTFLFESTKGRDHEVWMEDKIRSGHKEWVCAVVNWIENQAHWQNILSKVKNLRVL